MAQRLFITAVLVREYDEPIDFYVGKLGFDLRFDNRISETKRWVVLAPRGGNEGCILLAKAETQQQAEFIGRQTGGRVFLFLDTDDFNRDYADYTSKGVSFVKSPRIETYGIVAVFEDLYGNRWDLIQHTGYFGIDALDKAQIP